MLRVGYPIPLRLLKKYRFSYVRSSTLAPQGPNVPLELDPSLQALLQDADLALANRNSRRSDHPHSNIPRELDVLPLDDDSHSVLADAEIRSDDEGYVSQKTERKSAAALFGSQRIGSVFIPAELIETIEHLIADSDKSNLRNDAKRLFLSNGSDDSTSWHTSYGTDYKSCQQAARHSERDGTAFASVALPAHYSVVRAVLENVKWRLGQGWNVERLLDWGAGTGSGLWASMHSFQNAEIQDLNIEPRLSQSKILDYVGIDRRVGLTAMAKRLVQGIDLGRSSLTWQKNFTDRNRVRRAQGGDVIALSAFYLSSIPPLARKDTVKEMWESGANVFILIDHDSNLGFQSIAEAREYLLRMGRKEFEDPLVGGEHVGCHVIAPCPHDKTCPLYNPGSTHLICSFSQRTQRPAFIRKTKHVRAGHEDTGYTYVVVRRGVRPTARGDITTPIQSLEHSSEFIQGAVEKTAGQIEENNDSMQSEHLGELAAQTSSRTVGDEASGGMRLEAYRWPRVVFPPLKRSGHVILDSCTAEGKIMRMTIPRSQGKQDYYDARKSSWGDIFPHPPKNRPQVRYQPTRAKRPGGTTPTEGSDIGKHATRSKETPASSYRELTSAIKHTKKQRRRERNRERHLDNADVDLSGGSDFLHAED